MILWYLDRFGLPGNYRNLWVRLLTRHGINPLHVKTISMHKELGGTLLAKHGTRKAPTWNPIREPEIMAKIEEHIEKYKPSQIVLGAPEVLCATHVDPDFATLNNLRGSVYTKLPVPALVILPISAWVSKVSSREIGSANYGESDHEAFVEKAEEAMQAIEAKSQGKEPHAVVPTTNENHEPAEPAEPAADFDDFLKKRVEQGGIKQAPAPHLGDVSGEGEEDTEDRFWYEPVLVPVGKFQLEIDVAKLARYYNGVEGEHFDAY